MVFELIHVYLILHDIDCVLGLSSKKQIKFESKKSSIMLVNFLFLINKELA
jgi:hypothetical protein